MLSKISWVDVAHYATSALLLLMAGLSGLGINLPGITVDPKVAGAAGVGVFVAGLKGGLTSGK